MQHMGAYEVSGYTKPPQEINALSDRLAMGLPEAFVPTRIDEAKEYFVKFSSLSDVNLGALIASENQTLPERFAAAELLARRGDPRVNAFDPPMIYVPSGVATIGTSVTDLQQIALRYQELGVQPAWLAKEVPQHRCAIATFRLGEFPVTNCEYREFLLDNPTAELPSSWQLGVFPSARANHPVYSIAPETADAYCVWLSKRTKRSFRLPTEVEWEYAAAGPTGREFPWGDVFQDDCANTLESGLFQSVAVGLFPKGRSCFGLMDMAGQVEEYVSDSYAPYPGGEFIQDDLVLTLGSKYRVARGGSFCRFRDMARCSRRHGGPLPKAIYAMGFRLAESV